MFPNMYKAVGEDRMASDKMFKLSPFDRGIAGVNNYAGQTLMGKTNLAKYGTKAMDASASAFTNLLSADATYAMGMTALTHERGAKFLPALASNFKAGVGLSASIMAAGKIGTLLGGPTGGLIATGGMIVASALGINPVDHLIDFSKEKLQGLENLRGVKRKPLTQTVGTMKATQAQLGLLGQAGNYGQLGSEASFMHNMKQDKHDPCFIEF